MSEKDANPTEKLKKSSKKTTKMPAADNARMGLVKNDGYLEPYEDAIRGRHDHYLWKLNQLTNKGRKSLNDFANGHE